MTAYAGKAPLTLVICAGRRMVNVLAGAPVPEDALDSEIERLLDGGFIVKSDGDGGILGADAAEVPVLAAHLSSGDVDDDADDDGAAPAKKAPAKKAVAKG